MIKLNNVSKFYKSGFTSTYILRNITMDVKEGEFVSIMGPSGAGKTTLLNIIGMLDDLSEGEYLFFDEPVHKYDDKKRSNIYKQHIGFIFQSYHF